jgi:hypothetical protein
MTGVNELLSSLWFVVLNDLNGLTFHLLRPSESLGTWLTFIDAWKRANTFASANGDHVVWYQVVSKSNQFKREWSWYHGEGGMGAGMSESFRVMLWERGKYLPSNNSEGLPLMPDIWVARSRFGSWDVRRSCSSIHRPPIIILVHKYCKDYYYSQA